MTDCVYLLCEGHRFPLTAPLYFPFILSVCHRGVGGCVMMIDMIMNKGKSSGSCVFES